MSYHSYSIGMNGILDVAQGAMLKQGACPPSSTYTSMLARADELERTWNPTGFYTWEDMSTVIAATVQLAGQASSAAIEFFNSNSTPTAKDKVRAAANKYNAVAKQAVDYTEAWKAAKAAGKPVAAPGFKRWVIDDLRAAAELYRAIEIEICFKPVGIDALVSVSRFFVNVVNVAKRVGGVILKVGESALKAVERTGDIVGFLLSWAPYLALGVGGVLVYRHMKKRGG